MASGQNLAELTIRAQRNLRRQQRCYATVAILLGGTAYIRAAVACIEVVWRIGSRGVPPWWILVWFAWLVSSRVWLALRTPRAELLDAFRGASTRLRRGIEILDGRNVKPLGHITDKLTFACGLLDDMQAEACMIAIATLIVAVVVSLLARWHRISDVHGISSNLAVEGFTVLVMSGREYLWPWVDDNNLLDEFDRSCREIALRRGLVHAEDFLTPARCAQI